MTRRVLAATPFAWQVGADLRAPLGGQHGLALQRENTRSYGERAIIGQALGENFPKETIRPHAGPFAKFTAVTLLGVPLVFAWSGLMRRIRLVRAVL